VEWRGGDERAKQDLLQIRHIPHPFDCDGKTGTWCLCLHVSEVDSAQPDKLAILVVWSSN
jgi:hypothetical protein